MRLFHFVEQQRAATVLVQGAAKHSRVRGRTAQKQADRGLVLKLRHIEAVQVIRAAEVIRESYRDLRFADAGGADEQEGAFRPGRMRQVQLPSPKH